MRASRHCLILSLAFAVAACGFDAPPPQRTPPPTAPTLPVSTMTATLTLPMATIIDAINAKTKTEIANIKDQPVHCAIAECRLNLVATRTGPITGQAQNDHISLHLPLAATAELDMKTPLFKTKANTLATGTMNADTAIALGPDWHLSTETHGAVELSQAQLKLGPIKMGFADLWNRNADRLSAPLFKTIDKQLAASIKIKPQAERLWLKAQRPIKVGKSPVAWLLLEPERLRIAKPVTRNNALIVALGVDVRAHVVVADQAPEIAVNPMLPEPVPLAAPSNHFAFEVPVLLPYGEAANLALQRLQKTPLKIGGAHMRFEKLEILPSGQDVIVALRFCVSQNWDPTGLLNSCGEGYLRGAPQFDAQTHTIRIVRVHYDIATEGMILSVMRYLSGDALAKVLETKLVFDAGHDIEKLDTELKTAFAKPQGRGVQISGDVQSFGTPALTWTKDGFLATFPASGTIRADLNLKNGTPLDSQ